MPYLQLAENYLSEDAADMYVFIPAGYRGAPNDMYVREDYFDGMSNMEFAQIMAELEPYQPMLSAKNSEKKAARRAARQQKRLDKRASSKGQARRDARLARIQARQEGKTARAEMGGGFGGALDKIGGIAGSIFGGGGAGGDMGADERIEGSIDFGTGGEEAPKKNWIPWAIGGVVVVGGLIFLLTRKK